MSPRPRETSNGDLLAALSRVMQRVSPIDLTLADVAKEAGVVPATLIQRFGTKRELLLANCKAWTGSVPQQFAAARARHRSPLKALIEFFAETSSFAGTPRSMANFLAYLQIDLTDPEFRAVLLEQSKNMLRETTAVLEQAIAARELRPGDAEALARLILEVNSGAMLGWATRPQGTLSAWIRRSLESLLAPYRMTRRRRTAK
ncbi:MAG TPA: helix-turn-helix domain-containing protein [Candidatus Sulfotelmatobacter sp.]|nr:helix-turn-helix domain-containing protein [Candidatus Sulfotelmatobacter sp.]